MKHTEKRKTLPGDLRMLAWEVTRSCNLSCVHCRASSLHGPYEGELDTKACFALIDNIASFAKPVVILTGGEPLLNKDIVRITEEAADGDHVVVGPHARDDQGQLLHRWCLLAPCPIRGRRSRAGEASPLDGT